MIEEDLQLETDEEPLSQLDYSHIGDLLGHLKMPRGKFIAMLREIDEKRNQHCFGKSNKPPRDSRGSGF